MNTLSEETPRVKSSGSAGGKNRRISIGIKTSGKSSGEEVNSVPNYLRASTSSNHDIREREAFYLFTRILRDNKVLWMNEIKEQGLPYDIVIEANDKSRRYIERMKVVPLKDQNRMQKSEPKQTSSDKIQTQALQDGEAESEVYIESIKFDFLYSSMELKDPPACDSSLVQIEALDGFETEPEVTLETMEFDFILPSMELINPPVCNESEPFSCNDIGEEESLITYTVNERSELIPDEELPENSTIMPTVIESSHASSDKEVSKVLLIALPVSQSTQDEGVLEDESENEKEVAAAQNDEMITTAGGRGKVLDIQSENNDSKNGRKSVVLKHRQGEQEKKDAHGLLNNIIEETASKLAESRKSKVKALVGAFETVISLSKTANPLPRNEESSIAPLVVDSSHASSDKEESLIAPPVSESTQDEGVLEDESEYTDDHNEEVEVSEDESESSDNEKEVAAAQNDEMDTPSEETPARLELCPFHAFSDKEVSEESLIALLVSESTQDEGVLEDSLVLVLWCGTMLAIL
ncbi:ribonuclease H-like domain-containing protein [Tanacetum coccineum]|uniref:Ribonuclease H-like domain-containing protein n=1 Tax=Tanacetum coccineum TaxID=301880 RepID=A0ABQ5F0U5_9ASTR